MLLVQVGRAEGEQEKESLAVNPAVFFVRQTLKEDA
jgi:hypothetical protein